MSKASSAAQEPAGAVPDRAGSASTSTLLQDSLDWLASVFRQPLPVYGGAMAAVLLAVLIAPLLQQSELSVQEQLNRSLDSYVASDASLPAPPVPRVTRRIGSLFDTLSTTEVERQQFQLGLVKSAQALGSENVAQWQAWITGLPTEPVDCSKAVDGKLCSSAAEDISTLGQWSLLAYAACQPGAAQAIADSDAFWEAQYELFDQLRTQPGVSQSTVFAPLSGALAEKTPAALCTRMEALMSIGQ